MKNTKKQIKCEIKRNQDQESYYQQLYYQKPEEEIIPAKKVTKWNDKPFQFDNHLFTDVDQEAIQQDIFETLDTHTQVRRFDKNRKLIWVTKPNHKFEEEIAKRLEAARPTDWSEELPFNSKEDERARGSQLNRLIIETCSFTGNTIKIPQLTQKGDTRIDAHLKIEEMAKFMKITYIQAKTLARMYKTLNIDFKTAIFKKFKRPNSKKRQSLNMHIRDFVKATKKQPWEMQLSEGKTIKDYVQEVQQVTNWVEQEDPDWSYEPDFKIDTKYAFMAHLTDGEEYTIKSPEDVDEDLENPVGLYTYHYQSRIPDNPQFLGRHGRRFMRLMEKADKLTQAGLKTATEWVKKQKKEGIQGKDYNKIYYKRIEIWERKVRELQNQRAVAS